MKNSNGREISGTMNVIFIELPKIRNLPDDPQKLTKVEMWGKFFLYASNADRQNYIRELSEHNRGIDMAVTVLENVSRDEMNWYHESRYWIHVADMKSQELAATERGLKIGIEQGIAQGIAQGIQHGTEQGIQQGKEIASLENAQKMLQLGIDFDTIYKVTGITQEQLEK